MIEMNERADLCQHQRRVKDCNECLLEEQRAGAVIYLGIDPGKSGGIVSILTHQKGETEIEAVSMPPTERDVWEFIQDVRESAATCHAVIEQVQGYIGGAQPGSAMFKFGMSYGGLRMALVAAGIPFTEVVPRKWQAGLGIAPRKRQESKTAWKNRLKSFAQNRHPELRVTLGTADALLLADYCRQQNGGRG